MCKICNFHAQNLGIHLKKIHNINPKDYEGTTTSEKSSQKYAKNASENSWLHQAIENGTDLTEYWEKVSIGVKAAIINNPEERQRRAKVMTEVNQSDVMKTKASEAAKKTSARPEILEQRTKQLQKWRDENPEDFYEKCIVPMISSFQSKPEKILFDFVVSLPGFDFKRNQFINSKAFSSKSLRRQIDIKDNTNKIFIEFDGAIHFKDIFGEEILIKNQTRDQEVEIFIKEHNYLLIRISHDQFKYSTKQINKEKIDNSYFKQECLDRLLKILNDNQPGIYKIGEVYG